MSMLRFILILSLMAMFITMLCGCSALGITNCSTTLLPIDPSFQRTIPSYSGAEFNLKCKIYK